MSKTEQIYDPVFAAHGMRVYSREYVARVREENERLREGEILYNICPQEGFQERVCASDAGILIIGGRRGGGKTIGIHDGHEGHDGHDGHAAMRARIAAVEWASRPLRQDGS